MKRKTISLCTFVKNEAHCIGNMIRSVDGLVSEIVLVDTGSTDGTIEAAIQAASCPVRVYHIKFTNFGEIRTITSHLARGDYVLMLDADEELSGSEHLLRLIALGHDAYAFPRRRWADLDKTRQVEIEAYPDLQVRFYKNNTDYVWRRELHEYFDGASVTEAEGPVIEHFHDVHKDAARLEERRAQYEQLAKIAGVTIEGGYEL